MHAALAFFYAHPKTTRTWMEESNYIVVVSVEDETEVVELAEQACNVGIEYATFCEGDLGGQMTAVALQPGLKAKHLCANLPLALKECTLSSTVEQSALIGSVAGSIPAACTQNLTNGPEPVDSGEEIPDISNQRLVTSQKGSGDPL